MKRNEVMEDLNAIRAALKAAGWECPTLQDCIAVAQIEWLDGICARLAGIEDAIRAATT